jgi:uncharacterized membrane protein
MGVGEPVRIADEQVDGNGRVAAFLTRLVGSMWTVYATVAVVAAWMALGLWGPLRRVDPYPFRFLLFLGNVAQLLLCFVILVGQRVIGRAADRRAEQTYEHAEDIFREVSALHDHLVRQDRMLSRGVSLREWHDHPWMRRHRVRQPPRARDQATTLNGRLGAWLTQRMGSMWAFSVAVVVQVTWIGLAQAGVLRIDAFPYPFLLFVSSLLQLVVMFVITVGQDVLGRTGDRRSEQTFLNAEAILHQCRQLEAHLTAQDRFIASLCGYLEASVTERLARAMHAAYLRARLARGEAPASRPALRPWEELPEDLRDANRDQARHVGDKLAAIGCVVLPHLDGPGGFVYQDEDEVRLLARMEHDRWMRERRRAGRAHPDLVPWEDLSPEAREKDTRFVLDMPALLEEAGFRIVRLAPAAS